ncbi:MAG TPA: glycosyltransferase family 4 protein [Candidatus Brocadiia bacterium]|nr:glycosyltransferase family 4 protein [Candidatus Brocadiia bacterium]
MSESWRGDGFVAAAQLGARHHYAVPAVFHQAGMLGRFYTDLFLSVESAAYKSLQLAGGISGAPIIKRALGRFSRAVPRDLVTHFPTLAMRYAWERRHAAGKDAMTALHVRTGIDFNRRIVKRWSPQVRVVYSMNTASADLFEWCRANGVRSMLDQTIVDRRTEIELVAGESRAWSGWEPAFEDSVEKELVDVELREWEATDAILCPSVFVADALAARGVPRHKLLMNPYGMELGHWKVDRSNRSGGELKCLFAGRVCLRKGAPYLLDAAKRLAGKNVSVRFVGPVSLTGDKLGAYRDCCEIIGAVPREQMPSQYEWADVFVLPSVCEGSATVCYEALSAGLPVITTPNAGSWIRDGIEGYVVPARDSNALADRIMSLEADRDKLRRMSDAAIELSKQFAWERYGPRLKKIADNLRDGVPPGEWGEIFTLPTIIGDA